LSIVVLIINWPYLHYTFVPVHDTIAEFQFFHYFYSEWFFHKEVAQWLPYNTYGLPSQMYQLMALTPVDYLGMLLGGFFGIKNALWLFKICVVASQLVFLLGMYLLSRLIFERKTTVLFVCLGAVASTVWHCSINTNFRFYYMFPLIAYFIVLFFLRRKAEFLWLAGMTTLTWIIGAGTPYYIGFWIFLLFVFTLFLSVRNWEAWKDIYAMRFSNIFLFLVFILFAFSLFLYFKQSVNSVLVNSVFGRTAGSGIAIMENFMTHGGKANLLMIIRSLLFSSPLFLPVGSQVDVTVYVGILPVLFFVISFAKIKNKIFLLF